jgi:hypothetical protein
MGLPSTYQLRNVSICVFACVVRRSARIGAFIHAQAVLEIKGKAWTSFWSFYPRTRIHTYFQAVLLSMEEEVGIVLDEGIVVNRHSLRRILRGPGDVEQLVRFIFVLTLLPGVCRVRFILLSTLTYTPSARRRVDCLRG